MTKLTEKGSNSKIQKFKKKIKKKNQKKAGQLKFIHYHKDPRAQIPRFKGKGFCYDKPSSLNGL